MWCGIYPILTPKYFQKSKKYPINKTRNHIVDTAASLCACIYFYKNQNQIFPSNNSFLFNSYVMLK